MKQKNRIHLSNNLRAQISPHPKAGTWLKRALLFSGLLITAWVFLTNNSTAPTQSPPLDKQILGEHTSPAPEYLLHTVKSGETLFNISQRYGFNWQILAEINSLEEPYTLHIGQTIRIPK